MWLDRLVKMTIELSDPEKNILEAARKVFEINGYTGARMQQIADEAGISKASLHYYFRSKQNLFDRIFEVTFSEFFELLTTWSDDSEPWELKLRNFVRAFFQFLRSKSMLFLIVEINRNPAIIQHRKKKSKPKTQFILYFEKLLSEGKIKVTKLNEVYVFLHSLCAYHVLNRSMFRMGLGMSEAEYEAFMATYPDYVSDLLVNTLKKGLN